MLIHVVHFVHTVHSVHPKHHKEERRKERNRWRMENVRCTMYDVRCTMYDEYSVTTPPLHHSTTPSLYKSPHTLLATAAKLSLLVTCYFVTVCSLITVFCSLKRNPGSKSGIPFNRNVQRDALHVRFGYFTMTIFLVWFMEGLLSL